MKIAVVADIHSNLEALEEALKKIRKEKVKKIIFAGDSVGYNTNPNKCCDLLKGKNIIGVLGNHGWAAVTGKGFKWFNPPAWRAIEWTREKLTKENKRFLRGLPDVLEEKIGGKRIMVVHGSPDDYLFDYIMSEKELRLEWFEDIDILIFGHTHTPLVKKIGGKLALNPGSVGQPRDGNPKASFALLDTKKMKARIIRFSYDIDKTSKKIIDNGLPMTLAERLYVGW